MRFSISPHSPLTSVLQKCRLPPELQAGNSVHFMRADATHLQADQLLQQCKVCQVCRSVDFHHASSLPGLSNASWKNNVGNQLLQVKLINVQVFIHEGTETELCTVR